MKSPFFELLIFDLDGVLVDTSSAHARAFSDLWQRVGIQGPAYHAIAGRKTEDVVRESTSARKPSPEEMQQWVRFKQAQARAYLADQSIVYEDTIPSLEVLSNQRYRMALGTAASGETARWILKRLGLEHFFSVIVTAEDLQRGKPSPEIYLKVMSIADVAPDRTLIIEDSLSGLQSAVASQACVASVRSGIEIKSDRFIGHFSTLADLIERAGLKR